jgi:hypothetical protein
MANEANDAVFSDEAIPETIETSQFFGSSQEAIAQYTHCALCKGYLHFTHLTDFVKNLTQEIAKCPECGIRARKLLYSLQ